MTIPFGITEEELSSVEQETKGETRACNLCIQLSSSLNEIIDQLVTNCSSLTKIERSFAYCLRFIANCRKKTMKRIISKLTLPELNTVHCYIIKYSQQLYFSENLKKLQDNQELNPSSKLHQLHAFLDGDGVIKVGGRLQELRGVLKENTLSCC